MFPPLLRLVLLLGLFLCLPLGIFPLPLLALEKRLYLREQDTGEGFYLVIGNSCAVVVDFFFLAMEAAKVLRARCRFIWESGLASPL